MTDRSGTPHLVALRGGGIQWMAGPEPHLGEGRALKTYVCNTPILNSRVAGAWLAASMPMLIIVSLR